MSAINNPGKSGASPANPLWDDLRTPVTRGTTGANNPTLATFRDGLQLFSFNANTMNQVFFDVQLPHGWLAGSEIRPHIHWSPGSSTNDGTVRWGLEYTWANAVNDPGVEFPASATLYAEEAADGVAYKHHIAEFGGIDGTGKRLSSVLVCRLFRDAGHVNDTFTGAAFGVSVDFHIQLAGDGSVDEYPIPPN